MLSTTTHLVLLQNESSNPQKVMLNTQLFHYFVVWDKNSNKTNNDVWEANFNISETAVREQGEYILGMLVILFCYCQTGTKQLEAKH